ncbi:hypothetical protein K491DRAFT_684541 [Lophiostoma macrostomum CBS 122681]|uniref:Uncharacterized protein n=1 Tax=Lophiostoma macrostomum CBS 122681 TaxID=1314788 RepID=A0A6A6SPV2_9PLEO|nr:hypothetical protein K491DRAFT_684541 [Lophiostoma macrostomum CBS 122681]
MVIAVSKHLHDTSGPAKRLTRDIRMCDHDYMYVSTNLSPSRAVLQLDFRVFNDYKIVYKHSLIFAYLFDGVYMAFLPIGLEGMYIHFRRSQEDMLERALKKLKDKSPPSGTSLDQFISALTPKDIYTTHRAQLAIQWLIHTEATQVAQANFKEASTGFENAFTGFGMHDQEESELEKVDWDSAVVKALLKDVDPAPNAHSQGGKVNEEEFWMPATRAIDFVQGKMESIMDLFKGLKV